MENMVFETINRFNLLVPGDRVLVAVSGGADSLCLLHLLGRKAKELDITLFVAHVNHGLRPEAAAEAAYVKKWALRLGLPVAVCRVDVGACVRAGGYSKQDAARRVRYASLQRIAVRVKANRLAVAHHLDDRVETVLLRLLSGSGLDGLSGIPVKRELADGLTIIRPLHNVWRTQIEHYCSRHKLRPVFDRSNLNTHYLRNRVRLRLLPFLEAELGNHVRKSLLKTSELLARDSNLVAELTERAFRESIRCMGNESCILKLDVFQKQHEAVQSRLLRRLMWAAGVERPSEGHVQSVLALAQGGSPSGSVSLPGGIAAQRSYGEICIGRKAGHMPATDEVCSLNVPGRTVLAWGNEVIEADIVNVSEIKLPLADRREACLDLDLLQEPLQVRARKPGDRVRLLGAAGQRKVKSILIDRKIPLKERDMIPLLLSGGQIAWIGGVETAHDFRVTKGTKRVLYLRLCPNNNKKE
ncbi:MAG: tRNA lysidine(34) synthetase TilS [Dethiobacter sp.]|jgi:tRNA(Ile)-lysidine synthase|nr:tRNA lysidine(34) synthetase TilS [Dethiobacter sp.]